MIPYSNIWFTCLQNKTLSQSVISTQVSRKHFKKSQYHYFNLNFTNFNAKCVQYLQMFIMALQKNMLSFIFILEDHCYNSKQRKDNNNCYNYRCNIIKVLTGINTPLHGFSINVWQHDLSIQYNNTSLTLPQLNFWNFYYYYYYKLHHFMPVTCIHHYHT